jgi:hypothetical protein
MLFDDDSGEVVLPRYVSAVIDTGAHGRFVIVDVTDEHLPVGSLSNREQPVVFRLPRTLTQTTIIEGAPGIARLLGQPFTKAGDGWSVKAEIEKSGTTWRADCELKLKRVRYEPSAFEELKSLFRALARASALRVQYAAGAP